MKSLLRSLAIILVSVVLSWIMLNNSKSVTATSKQGNETAYERVIRTGTIRCGYMPWPLFIERDPKTNELKGLLKDVLDQMFSTLELKVEYVETVLGQQPQDLVTGKYDAFCFDSFLMPKASKYVDYSKPWTYMPMYLYGLSTASSATDLNHFNQTNYTFSSLDGDTSLDLAVRFFPRAKLLSLANTADPSLLMLNVITHKADFVIIDSMSIKQFEQENGPHFKRAYPGSLAVYPFNLSVKKGETGLRDLINYAVDIFVYTGNYTDILDRYDPDKIMTRIDTQRKE